MSDQEIIELARKFINRDLSDPQSEIICIQFFDTVPGVEPKTEIGKIIVDYAKAEIKTDFSLTAGEFYETTLKSVFIYCNLLCNVIYCYIVDCFLFYTRKDVE